MSFELEIECTATCKHTDHGNKLTTCLTKREISEEKLISYLINICGNFSRNVDEHGRSALHVACSNSKPLVAEFLLKNGANVLLKDFENCWTPMHRAINYAALDTAVVLKKFGSTFDSLDADFLTPLQLVPKPKFPKNELGIYVWGRNKNYNLGIGSISSRNQPELLKGLPECDLASINKFHSLFVTKSGDLWGCGHGKEGRLGTGAVGEVTLTSPQRINAKFNSKSEIVRNVSAGMTHSLLITNRSVYGTGSNKYYQLGLKDVEVTMTFKEIPFVKSEFEVKNILNVVAADFHSVFTSKKAVFVCGLNVGQFGGIQESIPVPRRLPYPTTTEPEIIFAASNNACICVYLSDKKSYYLHIFCNRKLKTYKNPLNEKLRKCVISGGELLYNSDEVVKFSSQKPLTITILTEHQNIYIWYEDIMQFVKVHLSVTFTTQISDMTPAGDDLMFNAGGHIFNATIQHKVQKLYQIESQYKEFSMKRDIAQFLCTKMTVKRIPHLSNVRRVNCESDGESFIVIMEQAKVPVKDPAEEIFDFSTLLDDYQYSDSGIMDIGFQIGREIVKANKFVVSARCNFLKDLIKSAVDGVCVISDPRLSLEMFNCILIWIYKNSVEETELMTIVKTAKDDGAKKKILDNFRKVLDEWELEGIIFILMSCKTFSKLLKLPELVKINRFRWFSISDLPDLYDVTILLDENQQLRAHKVVLMMRIEYFKMMFYHSWSEDSSIDLRHVSVNYMKPIIQYAYDNDADALRNANFSDNFMYNMCAILDQYLIENIKNIFEAMIMRKVNLRNCAENLDFSFTYNCHLLKDYCMEFICLNLSRLMESNVLDFLDMDILKELSQFYRKYFNFETSSNHILTPSYDAPTDEEIEEAIRGFDLTTYPGLVQPTKKTAKSKNKLSKSELLKRTYEKEGMKTLKTDEDTQQEPATPKSPEVSFEIDVDPKGWQKPRERKDSGKKKVLAAVKVNETMKNENVQIEPMVNLKSLRKSLSEEPEVSRNAITLADFGVISKKKVAPPTPSTPVKVEPVEPKPAWNMNNVELKPANQQNSSDPFKITPAKKSSTPKPSPSEKHFSSIIKNERKDKTNYEKIKSKSLVLTQIEEKAIMELSEFYNIDNIFDETITIQRKVQVTSQNLSQWHQANGNHKSF